VNAALLGVCSAILLLLASALLLAVSRRAKSWALQGGTALTLAACALGLGGAVLGLADGGDIACAHPWNAPFGQLQLGLDPLSSFFLLCLFLLAGLSALYGGSYLRAYLGKRSVAPAIMFAQLLVASMAAILVARHAVVFLMAWEVMSVSSYFLVAFEHDRPEVRRAAFTYLIASHVGVVFLFVAFALLGDHAGSFSFADFLRAGVPAHASVIFVMALVGFGTKAGLWPVHVWLPEAHPAAPSHVSALMSGVMIKMGIYGLLRLLTFLGTPLSWWAVLVLVIGGLSGVAGVLLALAQHDIKRLLAYHSVENIGIITLGVGLGMLGQSAGHPAVAVAGYAGALLHVLNHGLFKSLLFQGAGSVLHATGTRDFSAFGGLGRRMPATALTFLVGAVAISGLPPLNGFVSEWLIYVGAFVGGSDLRTKWAVCATLVIPTLALIGGLAVACFVKAFGITFLGEPRSKAAAEAHEVSFAMRLAMGLGATLCILIGLWPDKAVSLVLRPAHMLAGSEAPFTLVEPLVALSRVAVVVICLTMLLTLLRRALLARRDVRSAPTWGCGYDAPTARMQYTAPSFAEPLLAPFSAVIPKHAERTGPTGYFPSEGRYSEHLADMAGERLILPATRRVVGLMSRLRIIQQGRTQLYLTYMLVTLIVLLVWQLGGTAR
jgi:hydrogenase-4 component B